MYDTSEDLRVPRKLSPLLLRFDLLCNFLALLLLLVHVTYHLSIPAMDSVCRDCVFCHSVRWLRLYCSSLYRETVSSSCDSCTSSERDA